MRRFLPHLAAVAALAISAQSSWAQTGRERPSVDKAIAFLRGHTPQLKDAGEAAFSAMAMIKASPIGVIPDYPEFNNTVARFATTFTANGYQPETKGGPDIYEASVTLMCLINLDPVGYKDQINMVAQYLMAKQMGNGAWDYSNRTAGDTSMSQYALLGLWEAESEAGIVVRPEVWDRAAKWYLGVQGTQGSWNYHRDESQWPETISMTGAGVGSLLICQKQLARHRKGQDLINPLMIPLTVDGQPADSRYKVETPALQIKQGIERGLAWTAKNFQVNTGEIMGQSPYYALYGIERMAGLDTSGTLKSINWYEKGLDFAISTQKSTGAWNAQHEDLPNTCWALLFMVKSTEIINKKIELRRLAGGQQKGSRGLPGDLSNVEVVDGKIVARPMGGAIEGMLKILENPESDQFASALRGIELKYNAEGPKALRPYKDRFRKLVADRDVTGRVIALWGLGHMGDLDVAPILIKALLDPDEDVVEQANRGLQILSRKIDGFGLPDKPTPEQQQEAAKKWLAWYESVKPPDLDAPDDVLPVPAPAAPTPAAAGNAPKP